VRRHEKRWGGGGGGRAEASARESDGVLKNWRKYITKKLPGARHSSSYRLIISSWSYGAIVSSSRPGRHAFITVISFKA